MGIRILSDNHYSEFIEEFKEVKKQLRIVTPFLSFSAIKKLLVYVNSDVEIILITRFKREDFLTGVSNLEALRLLRSRGAKIYSIKDLHGKMYLFDNKSAVVGSANMTMGGLLKNIELSLLFDNEVELIDELSDYFNKLVDNSEDYYIDELRIAEEDEQIQKIINNRKGKNINYGANTVDWGAEMKAEPILDTVDEIQSIIEKQEITELNKTDINYWLKFAGTGVDLMNPEERFRESRLNDGTLTEHSGRKMTGIQNGDIIYLTPLSWDSTSQTPIVIGKAETKGYMEGNVVTEADINREGYQWMERWSHYIEIFNVQKISGNIKEGVSLNKLLPELQSDLYVSTQGKNLPIQTLKKSHLQKSHIKITPKAANYIDSMLGFK